MKKDCVILSSWVPSSDRMEPYVRVLKEYYSDCDIYVGVNPSDYAELWIQKLKESGLNIIAEITPKNLVIPQHASAVQTALKLYKDSDTEYNLVHFIHTKGISYLNQPIENQAYKDYYLTYATKIPEIRKFMENNLNYGGWGDYGIIQYQWFRREEPIGPTIHDEMADSEHSTKDVHSYFDWSRFYPFKHTPMRTQWMTGFYTIRHGLLRNFIDNCSDDFLNKNIITEMGFDIYMFETHIAQVVCRQGYLRYIDKMWINNLPFNGKELEKRLTDLWIKENDLDININDYV
tara:strand:+ start:1364 stop:2233 length:870 start_codon:yes stop_codon:yes gene_type:complete